MPHAFSFSGLHDYGISDEGILVPVTLSIGEESVECTARRDTGSTFLRLQTRRRGSTRDGH